LKRTIDATLRTTSQPVLGYSAASSTPPNASSPPAKAPTKGPTQAIANQPLPSSYPSPKEDIPPPLPPDDEPEDDGKGRSPLALKRPPSTEALVAVESATMQLNEVMKGEEKLEEDKTPLTETEKKKLLRRSVQLMKTLMKPMEESTLPFSDPDEGDLSKEDSDGKAKKSAAPIQISLPKKEDQSPVSPKSPSSLSLSPPPPPPSFSASPVPPLASPRAPSAIPPPLQESSKEDKEKQLLAVEDELLADIDQTLRKLRAKYITEYDQHETAIEELLTLIRILKELRIVMISYDPAYEYPSVQDLKKTMNKITQLHQMGQGKLVIIQELANNTLAEIRWNLSNFRQQLEDPARTPPKIIRFGQLLKDIRRVLQKITQPDRIDSITMEERLNSLRVSLKDEVGQAKKITEGNIFIFLLHSFALLLIIIIMMMISLSLCLFL
jgi:hypothetical protein